jgi:hypothetical protein
MLRLEASLHPDPDMTCFGRLLAVSADFCGSLVTIDGKIGRTGCLNLELSRIIFRGQNKEGLFGGDGFARCRKDAVLVTA